MEFFWIWLYLTLSKFGSEVLIGLWWTIAGCGIILVGMASHTHYPTRKGTILMFFFLGFGFFIHTVALLVPDKEDLAYIIGGGIALKIAQTEEAQKLPENTLKALNKFLESVHEEEVEQ